MTRIVRFIRRHVFLAILLALVALALLLTAARLLTPALLVHYADDIAAIATERLGQPVTIGSLSARWHGVGPVLVLRDVSLWQPGRPTPALRLDEIEVDFGAADMLSSGYLAPGRITVRGARLTVVRHADGTLGMQGLGRREGDISALLLGPTRARLLDARVEWLDNLRQRPPMLLEASDILVRNDGKRHQLDADFLLGNRRFSLRADLSADSPYRLSDWQGEVYLRAADLDLARLLADEIPVAYDLRRGTGNVEIWSNWSGGRLQSLTGSGVVHDLSLAGSGGAVVDAEAIEGRFDWHRADRGWRLDVAELAVRRAGRSRPPGRVSLEVRSAGSTAESWHIRADHLELADLAAVAAIRPPRHALLADLLAARPGGEIGNIDLRFRPRAGFAFAVSAGIRNLGMAAHGPLPMLDNFTATVHATNNGGRLELATRDAAIHPVRLFRWPIPLERLEAGFHWQRAGSLWRVSATDIEAANRHISTRSRLRLDLGGEGGPFLDLQTDFRDAQASYTPAYLPTGIMPDALVAWLDRSILGGHVRHGSCIVRGPLRDFPFHRTHSGHFEVLFDFENTVLDYREGWPRLEDIAADVRFHNNSLHIFNGTARLYDSRLGELEARIDSLHPAAPLEIGGRAQGPLQDIIRLLRETPLRETPLRDTYAPFADDTSADGDSRLELRLSLPLRADAGEHDIEGTLVFDNSTLKNRALGIDLEAIEGPLQFGREGVSSRRLSARLAGNRLAASVTPTATGTRIRASGQIETGSIGKAYPVLAAIPLDGTSVWDLAIELPPPARFASRGVLIEARSDLEGTQVQLPLGLGKPAQGQRPFEARLVLRRQGLGNLEMGFGDLRMTGRPGPGGWMADLESPAVTGGILFPPPAEPPRPVVADFDRLSVSIDPRKLGGDPLVSRTMMDPAGMPELELTAHEVLINGNPYGELTAKTRLTAGGVHLEEMRLASAGGELRLSGDWTAEEAGQETALNFELHTSDLGTTLRDLAISQAVTAGKGRIEADLEWQGSPGAIRRETLSGAIRFHAEDGRFEEAEPGVGRLFGLLNIAALQRRLRLDFSDLFREGFSFEQVEGEFVIDAGLARTDNTRITGPAGDIRIEGVTDLAKGMMDQDIYVVPAISGAVALAGGIAAGPLVGAALLAAGKGIDRLATVHYRMTGHWDDPRVEPAPRAEADDSTSPETGLPAIH